MHINQEVDIKIFKVYQKLDLNLKILYIIFKTKYKKLNNKLHLIKRTQIKILIKRNKCQILNSKFNYRLKISYLKILNSKFKIIINRICNNSNLYYQLHKKYLKEDSFNLNKCRNIIGKIIIIYLKYSAMM